jgi:actin-related protein
MGVLTEEDLVKSLEFKCARCQAECSKVNAAEPELGYVSHAPGHEGEFVGPLCTNCYNQTPEQERVIRKLPETAFLLVIRQDGEGAYMTTEGINIAYLREPTFNDILRGCEQVSRDIHDSLFAQKITMQLVRTLATKQKHSNIIVPR